MTNAACGTFRANDCVGSWVQLPRLHPFTRIKATANQGIEGHTGLLKHGQTNARGRRQNCIERAGTKTDGLGKGNVGVAATGWKARASWLSSAHEQPNGQSTATKPLDELGPGEAVGIEGKHSHHQIQNLFVFPNQG